MRIAQVAPLFESVPPTKYGGTERIVSNLTEALVRRGHDVTLFASGDSLTQARLIAGCPKALWRSGCEMHDAYHTVLLGHLASMAEEFDLMHFHFDYWHLPVARQSGVPYVTTLHGRLDLPDLVPVYRAFPEAPVVSISDAQRGPLSWLNWQATVHHGLPTESIKSNASPQEYLAFVGRASPEKGLAAAIEIALACDMPLKISAAVQPANRQYFEDVIRPRLDHPLIEYVGELGGKEKDDLVANALALLFPIDWPEPFGLVMIEAMACGTPVIAFRRGSVPEVVEDGVSGFIVDNLAGAVESVGRLHEISRPGVRACFDARFSLDRMVDQYLDVYSQVIARRNGVEGSGSVSESFQAPAHVAAPTRAGSTRTLARRRARRDLLRRDGTRSSVKGRHDTHLT